MATLGCQSKMPVRIESNDVFKLNKGQAIAFVYESIKIIDFIYGLLSSHLPTLPQLINYG
jgi:hypothetical protein